MWTFIVPQCEIVFLIILFPKILSSFFSDEAEWVFYINAQVEEDVP